MITYMVIPPEIGEVKHTAGMDLTVIEREDGVCNCGVVRCVFEDNALDEACNEHLCNHGQSGQPDFVGLIWLRPEDFALARLTKKG